jgi:hypothetical protein
MPLTHPNCKHAPLAYSQAGEPRSARTMRRSLSHRPHRQPTLTRPNARCGAPAVDPQCESGPRRIDGYGASVGSVDGPDRTPARHDTRTLMPFGAGRDRGERAVRCGEYVQARGVHLPPTGTRKGALDEVARWARSADSVAGVSASVSAGSTAEVIHADADRRDRAPFGRARITTPSAQGSHAGRRIDAPRGRGSSPPIVGDARRT